MFVPKTISDMFCFGFEHKITKLVIYLFSETNSVIVFVLQAPISNKSITKIDVLSKKSITKFEILLLFSPNFRISHQ